MTINARDLTRRDRFQSEREQRNAVDLVSAVVDAQLQANNGITDIESQVQDNAQDISSVIADVSSNTSDIATNTADISTNTADIATNTADISTNTADIATNTADISTNTEMSEFSLNILRHLNSKGVLFSGSESVHLKGNLLTSTPITMVCWATVPNNILNQALMGISDFNRLTEAGFMMSLRSDRLYIYTRENSWTTSSVAHGKSPGQLVHCAAVYASPTSRTAYVDGVAGAVNTTAQTPTGLDTMSVGSFPGNSSYLNRNIQCEIYHPAFIGAALTPAEIIALAGGASPEDYGPVKYLPMVDAALARAELIAPLLWDVVGTLADGSELTTLT